MRATFGRHRCSATEPHGGLSGGALSGPTRTKMQRARLSPSQSDRAADAARAAAAARAARMAAQAARAEAAAAERRALVAKAASARAAALWGRETNWQVLERQDDRAAPIDRHVRGLDQVQHCLEAAAEKARQQAHAELHAARSLQALQIEAQRACSEIEEMLDAGEVARRRAAIARVRQRDCSNLVAEDELRLAWCRCVGTRALETGGTWEEQHAALSGLYAVLGQDDRDPTAVLVGAGGEPNQIAVTVDFWRFICAGLSLKYDLPTPEAVEVQHKLVCGGTLAANTRTGVRADRDSSIEWERVRRDLEASSAGEDGAVRARRLRFGLVWHETDRDRDRDRDRGGLTSGVSATDPVDRNTSGGSTADIHLSWSGAWTTLPESEAENASATLAQLAHTAPAAAVASREGGESERRTTAVSLSAVSKVDRGTLHQACVSAVGLGVSATQVMNDQARLMATRKQVQEYHPRLVAAQEAARNAQRRKSEAKRRLEHAKMKIASATASSQGRTQ